MFSMFNAFADGMILAKVVILDMNVFMSGSIPQPPALVLLADPIDLSGPKDRRTTCFCLAANAACLLLEDNVIRVVSQ